MQINCYYPAEPSCCRKNFGEESATEPFSRFPTQGAPKMFFRSAHVSAAHRVIDAYISNSLYREFNFFQTAP